MIKNSNQVNYKLAERWEITQYLKPLVNLQPNKKNLRQVVQDLRGMGPEVVPVLLKLLQTAEEHLFTYVVYAVETLADETNVPELIQLLLSPSLDDWRKSQLMAVLQALGVDPLELPVDALFHDLDEAMNNSLTKVLTDIKANVYNVPMVVAEIGKLPPEVYPVVIDELVHDGTKAACVLLYYLVQVDNAIMTKAAIKGLERVGSSIALRLLNELQTESELAEKVERSIQKLHFKGVKAWQRPLSYLPKVDRLFDVSVSAVDHTGSRVIFVAWYAFGRKQMLTTVNLLINTNSGLIDCWGTTNLPIKEYYDIKNDFKETMFVVNSNAEYGATLVSDALYQNQLSQHALPWEWSFWRRLLSDHWLQPQALQRQLPQTSVDHLLLSESDTLLDLPLFNGWTILNQQVIDVAQQIITINESKIEDKSKVRLRIGLFNQLMASIFGEQTQGWKDRIALTIEFCEYNHVEITQLDALRNLYAAIGLIAFENIPFFSRLLLDSLQKALQQQKSTSF